jgi:hypothetical protein
VLALVVIVGVTGDDFAGVFTALIASVVCFPRLTLEGVIAWIGVTGITGTAGVILDEVVRDIGRDPARDKGPSMTAFGMAGTVNPGGTEGVARRIPSSMAPLMVLPGMPCGGSGSLSFTRASTLNDACSSALKGTSMRIGQHLV